MEIVNHLLVFAQPEFVNSQVRGVLAHAPRRPSRLSRAWKRLRRA